MTSTEFTSGFAAIVGRPNTGKSTLLNAAMGSKVAITSDRPQTTRRVIRAIITRPDGQLILVDTPGIHRPRTLLGERLNDEVKETYSTVDAVALCIPVNEPIGPGDRYIAKSIAGLSKSIYFALVTKTDLGNPEQIAKQLLASGLPVKQLHCSSVTNVKSPDIVLWNIRSSIKQIMLVKCAMI